MMNFSSIKQISLLRLIWMTGLWRITRSLRGLWGRYKFLDVKMYFHVRITQKSRRAYDEIKLDLSEEGFAINL